MTARLTVDGAAWAAIARDDESPEALDARACGDFRCWLAGRSTWPRCARYEAILREVAELEHWTEEAP